MFEYLRGKVKIKKPDYIGLDVNGVGYRVYITLKTYDQLALNDEVEMYIYNVIKEDTFKLVGFLQEIAFKKDQVSYSLIASALLDTDGVAEWTELSINKGTSNVAIGVEEVAILKEVNVYEQE